MKLYDLAYACRLYAEISAEDDTRTTLEDTIGSNWDLSDPAQRRESLIWLRTWGCRQFKKSEVHVASGSLDRWWDRWRTHLPTADDTIVKLNSKQKASASSAYEDLVTRRACMRGGSAVTFGPEGSSKLLSAIRPASFPIWDEPIRERLAKAGVRSYREFMDHVVQEILELIADASKFGIGERGIAAAVGRRNVPLVKLIDECNWIHITRGHEPADRETLQRWLAWSAQVPD